MNNTKLTDLAEDVKYFKNVVNTVFTEEPSESENISLLDLYWAYLKVLGKTYLDLAQSNFEKNIMNVIRSLDIEAKGYDADNAEDTYSKNDLWKIANTVFYWEKPGYMDC